MRNMIVFTLTVMLAVFISGCGKKPNVEAPTRASTSETNSSTQSGDGTAQDAQILQQQSAQFAAVYFDFDKYNLRDEAKDVLRKNAGLLKQNQELKLRIEGHCDERGTVEYNLALGEKRAKAVRDYLTSLGIDAGRLEVVSYGKERPAVNGNGEDAWSLNRRAEFVEK